MLTHCYLCHDDLTKIMLYDFWHERVVLRLGLKVIGLDWEHKGGERGKRNLSAPVSFGRLSYHVLLFIMFVPRLNKISWVVLS